MLFRILLVTAGLSSAVLVLLSIVTSDTGSRRTPADISLAGQQSAQSPVEDHSMVCESRMWDKPFDGSGPDDVALQFVRLDQFREQVLEPNGCWRLVNFWATWCEPCREEMPELVRLADRFRDHGLELITVNLEPPQLGNAAHSFLREHNANLVNFRLDIPDTVTIAGLLEDRWMGGIPFTMIINPVGDLVFWEHGLFDVEGVEQQLEQKLLPLQ